MTAKVIHLATYRAPQQGASASLYLHAGGTPSVILEGFDGDYFEVELTVAMARELRGKLEDAIEQAEHLERVTREGGRDG